MEGPSGGTLLEAELPPTIDPRWFRQVLGQYPTGVCVVTSRLDSGEPVAMVVGSFTSVSLDPPLIAFFPDRKSSSWAKLRNCAHFCVNILAADQEPVCRKLASKDPDKFSGTAHRISARGNPIIDGVVAWIECSCHSVIDAGDHEMVTGRILELDLAGEGLPLLFFQGGYGRFSPASMAAEQGQGLTLAQLRDVDRVRLEMERLAAQIGAQCIATIRVGDELAVAASAGQGRRGGGATLVGQRLPFVPPTGSVFAAWSSAAEQERWLAKGARDREGSAAALARVRARGYSLGLLNEAQRALSDRLSVPHASEHALEIEDLLDTLAYDPADLTPAALRAVRVISAPVLRGDGNVVLALTLHDFPKPAGAAGVTDYVEQLVSAASRLNRQLSGTMS